GSRIAAQAGISKESQPVLAARKAGIVTGFTGQTPGGRSGDSGKSTEIPGVSSLDLRHGPRLRAGAQERSSREVAARDGPGRLSLLSTLRARLVPGPDPQRAGFPAVHGRDEGTLGGLPARVRTDVKSANQAPMQAERRRQIERLSHSALQPAPQGRPALRAARLNSDG